MSTPAVIGQPYVLVSIERSSAPQGVEGSGWHRYEIAQGSNAIHGYRQGELDTVTAAVELMVTQLNERRGGKRGRTHPTRVPKK